MVSATFVNFMGMAPRDVVGRHPDPRRAGRFAERDRT